MLTTDVYLNGTAASFPWSTKLMNANVRNGIAVYRLLMAGVVLHVIFVSLARQCYC